MLQAYLFQPGDGDSEKHPQENGESQEEGNEEHEREEGNEEQKAGGHPY